MVNFRPMLPGIAAVSAALLMTELALTRIFSVTMYYHFAFLAISIALFGTSASGVCAYIARERFARHAAETLLTRATFLYAVTMLAALFVLVRIQVTLTYTPANLVKTL